MIKPYHINTSPCKVWENAENRSSGVSDLAKKIPTKIRSDVNGRLQIPRVDIT